MEGNIEGGSPAPEDAEDEPVDEEGPDAAVAAEEAAEGAATEPAEFKAPDSVPAVVTLRRASGEELHFPSDALGAC